MRFGRDNSNGTPVKDDMCEYPAAYIRRTGCLTVDVKHGKEKHTLVLWPEDLDQLSARCRTLRDTMRNERDVA